MVLVSIWPQNTRSEQTQIKASHQPCEQTKCVQRLPNININHDGAVPQSEPSFLSSVSQNKRTGASVNSPWTYYKRSKERQSKDTDPKQKHIKGSEQQFVRRSRSAFERKPRCSRHRGESAAGRLAPLHAPGPRQRTLDDSPRALAPSSDEASSGEYIFMRWNECIILQVPLVFLFFPFTYCSPESWNNVFLFLVTVSSLLFNKKHYNQISGHFLRFFSISSTTWPYRLRCITLWYIIKLWENDRRSD